MSGRRIWRFVVIGTAGFVVQMTVAAALLAAGLMPVLATVLAIEAALVSNHAWHRRWAWRDRVPARPWIRTLLRAHVGAGGTSLIVGAGTVVALAGHVPPLVAQVIAVGLCAGANYWIADRWIFGRREAVALVAVMVVFGAPAPVLAAGPSREALQGWDRYAAALVQARAADLARGVPAWATDEDAGGASVVAALRRGEIVVTRRELRGVEVADATLEHWQGSLLVRGVTVEQVADRLRHPERFPHPRDVLTLRVADRTEAGHELFLRVTRSMLVTATYDTWYRVRHQIHGPARIDSTAVATRIDEISGAGTASEQRIRVEDSRGFLWRMQSLWRFAAVPEGVVVTCESITLSRPVPLGLGLASRPIVTRVARESMTTAVRSWQAGWK